MVLQKRHGTKEFSAGGIVYRINSNQIEWLVIQHSKHKGWIFPKGLIGDRVEGEGKEETAVREVEEEGGVKAKIVLHQPFSTNYIYTFSGRKIFKTVYFYLMEYISGDIKDHDQEVSDIKWLSAGDVVKQLSYKSDQEMFERAVKEFNLIRKK